MRNRYSGVIASDAAVLIRNTLWLTIKVSPPTVTCVLSPIASYMLAIFDAIDPIVTESPVAPPSTNVGPLRSQRSTKPTAAGLPSIKDLASANRVAGVMLISPFQTQLSSQG